MSLTHHMIFLVFLCLRMEMEMPLKARFSNMLSFTFSISKVPTLEGQMHNTSLIFKEVLSK